MFLIIVSFSIDDVMLITATVYLKSEISCRYSTTEWKMGALHACD